MRKNCFKKHRLSFGSTVALFSVLSLVSIILTICIGSVSVSPYVCVKVLLSKFPLLRNLISSSWEPLAENIVLNLRFPRVLLGFIVGASLSVCGVAMQALVRNNLADPFILGVSSGASAFATFGMLFGAFSFLGIYSLSISAFLGAMVTIIAVYALSRVCGRINITRLLLSGVAISMIMDGLTSIIKLSAPNALGLHNAEFWMAGSLAGAKWSYIPLAFTVLLVCFVFLMLNCRGLDILLLGETSAGALGVNASLLQKLLIVVSSLLAGVCVSVSGTIGFVGLMVPHYIRMLCGGSHKRVLPLSALLGGILVVWVDAVARFMLSPEELPVGVLTAVIGGPVFILMLRKNGKGMR